MQETANWRLVCLMTLGAFAGLSIAAFAAGPLPGDLPVRQEFVQDSGSLAYEVARLVDPAGTWIVLLPATLLLFGLSAEARRRWWLWSAILVGSSLIEHASKFLVGRPRPSGFALGFPSGHSTAVATFAVVLIYILGRERLAVVPRCALCVLAIATMLLVGWARIALRAHWPTDVLGGFLLGVGCAAAGAWWESARRDAARARMSRAA